METQITETDIRQLKKENRDKVKEARKDNRQEKKDAKDIGIVQNTATKHGIDLTNPPAYPLTDTYKETLKNDLSNLVKQEDRDKLSSFVGSIPNPNFVEQPTIDLEEEKRKARIQRKAKWADALYAFGEGVQGKVANPDNFVNFGPLIL